MVDIRRRRPEPEASGRFLLRLPVRLHESLRVTARTAGLSLNEYCCRRLAAPSPVGTSDDGTDRAVEWALSLFEDRLLAVLAYGSWARGEAARQSDVDLLVVVEQSVAITRELYRRWDARELEIDGRPVEPHFVHLPAPKRARTGLWAEVSLDGIVLFERGHEVSRCLAAVRRDVFGGLLIRRTVHGQPYWTEVT